VTGGGVIAGGRGRVTAPDESVGGATRGGAGRIGAGADEAGVSGAGGAEAPGGRAVAPPGLPPDNGVVAQAAIASSHASDAAPRAHLETNASAIGKGNIVMTRGEPSPVLARTLYVVATPIGNLRDITLRALDVLGEADIIAAEDTRNTATLTSHYGITARLASLHAHNERERAQEVIGWLAAGKRVALVTDAGTPAISDPGALLVRAVIDAGFAVVPIPGASAAIAALSASGLAAAQWLFCGFLPATAGARAREIERLRAMGCALVFYEAPHRIAATLDALAAALGPERELVIARELTKHFETIHRCALGDAAEWLAADTNRQRGEFVLIVEAASPLPAADNDNDDALLSALLAELPLAQSVRIAVAATAKPKNRVYERALALKKASAV
jgi:16S rRNA (cytidine1402-2'-O)-methyltransferase